MKKSVGRTILNSIIALILTAFITAFATFLSVRQTILSPDYLIDKMNQNHYADEMMNLILLEFESVGDASGVEREFFKSTLYKYQFEEELEKMIRESFAGITYVFKGEEMRTDFNNKLLEYASQTETNISDATRAGIEELTDYCMEFYEKQVNNSVIIELGNYINEIKVAINFLTVTLVLSIIILVILLFTLKTSYSSSYYYFSISLLSSSIIIYLISLYVKKVEFINNLPLEPAFFRNSLRDYFIGASDALIIPTVILAVLAVFVGMLGVLNYSKKNRVKRQRDEDDPSNYLKT